MNTVRCCHTVFAKVSVDFLSLFLQSASAHHITLFVCLQQEGASADADRVDRLREALTLTQTEVDKHTLPADLSPNPHRKRRGPLAAIGQYILNRRKRNSTHSQKSSSSTTGKVGRVFIHAAVLLVCLNTGLFV